LEGDGDFMKLHLINGEKNKGVFISKGVDFKKDKLSLLVVDKTDLKHLHFTINNREVVIALSDCWDSFPGNADFDEDEIEFDINDI
jgi:hypothetical protein